MHNQDIASDRIGWWNEVPIVTLPAAIEQCIGSGVPAYLVNQAIERGRSPGRLAKGDEGRLREMLARRRG